MKRVKTYSNFEECEDAVIMVNSEREVELIIDYLIPDELPKPKGDKIRFVATIQPEQQFNDLIRKHYDNYDYLLTFIPDLLRIDKARFFIGLTNFCEPDPGIEKIFGVSTIFSGRNCLPGHRLRHELEKRQDEITIPMRFFYGLRSGQKGPLQLPANKKDKCIAMRTMFHIAIDSYNYPNSFSEKLIDPLITKTVPIYWGPDVSEYFNENGIIKVESVDEIIEVCNMLQPEMYYRYLNIINENYNRALRFTNYGEQLRRKIQEVLDEDT